MTKEDVEIVSRAKTIHRYPVSRDKFIKTLGLGLIPSERICGGARGGRCSYLETWTLPSGNRVRAWDSEQVNMTPETIDQIIGVNRPPYDAYLDRGPAPSPFDFLTTPPRKFFESCVISSPRGKVFFSSTDRSDATNKGG